MAGIMFEKEKTVISQAILKNNLDGFKDALFAGEDPHFKDRKGNTYLHYLCSMNRPFLIHVLIGTRIDLNSINRHGNTALHVTALHNECCHVGDLMAAGIDSNIINQDGKTAAEIPNKNTFWNKIFEKYKPGIFEAIDNHDVDKVIYLLNCWTRIDTLREGFALRQFAACRKFHDLVFHIDLHQYTLNAIYAILEGNSEKAQKYLSHNKCNVNLLNKACDSKHILQEAIKLGNVKLVRMICKANVNINVRVRLKSFLKAPLFFIALNPDVSSEIRWTILRAGCDFTLQDERGRNAAVYGLDRSRGEISFDVIDFMMKNKLDVAQRDSAGLTFRDVVRFYRRKDILESIDKDLVKVIRCSDLMELERLCRLGYDSVLINYNYRDTFIYASGNESNQVLEFVQWIPTFQREVQRLFHCIQHSSLEEVSTCFNSCQNLHLLANAKDKGGRSPLHMAVLHWRFDVLKLLLQIADIDINAQDNVGRTALHYACCVEEEDERTEFCSILQHTDINQEMCDFTGSKAADYVGCVKQQKWLSKERKAQYGMKKQLTCMSKYEELYRLMQGKGKTVSHFNDAIKRFPYPIPKLHHILVPLVPKYRDLVHVAMDYGKEDIAVKLVQLGTNWSQQAQVLIDSGKQQQQSKPRSVLKRAKLQDMKHLVAVIEKKRTYQKHKAEEWEKQRKEINLDNNLNNKSYRKVRRLSDKEGNDDGEDIFYEEEVMDDSDDDKIKDRDDKEDNIYGSTDSLNYSYSFDDDENVNDDDN